MSIRFVDISSEIKVIRMEFITNPAPAQSKVSRWWRSIVPGNTVPLFHCSTAVLGFLDRNLIWTAFWTYLETVEQLPYAPVTWRSKSSCHERQMVKSTLCGHRFVDISSEFNVAAYCHQVTRKFVHNLLH